MRHHPPRGAQDDVRGATTSKARQATDRALAYAAVAPATAATESASACSAAPTGRSTFSASSSSARVRPRLIAATGLPAAAAACAKRKPEYTISDEPATSS